MCAAKPPTLKFLESSFFSIYNFCYCSVSIPLPTPPLLLKILFDLLFYIGLPNTTEKDMDLHRHVRKQHFLVCSSNSHTVFKCDVPKHEFYEEDENCCLYLWRMEDDCESLKNQKHCVWEWRNKTKNFQYWIKNPTFKSG